METESIKLSEDVFLRSASNADADEIKLLVSNVLREYGLEFDVKITDADLENVEENYFQRGGIFEVLEDAKGNLLGTIGLFPLDDKTVELRKMYFAKALRGKGLGSKLLKMAIAKAKALGFESIYLETADVLKEAVILYEKFGFVETDEIHSARCDRAFVLKL